VHISSTKGCYVKPTTTEIDRRLDTLKATSTKARSHHGQKVCNKRAPTIVFDSDVVVIAKRKRTSWIPEYTNLLAEVAATNLQENVGTDHDWSRIREVFLNDSRVCGQNVSPATFDRLNSMSAIQFKRFHHSWVVTKNAWSNATPNSCSSYISSSSPTTLEGSSTAANDVAIQENDTQFTVNATQSPTISCNTDSVIESTPIRLTLPIPTMPFATVATHNCDINYEEVIAIPLQEASASTKYSDDELTIVRQLLSSRKCHKGDNSINWRSFQDTYRYYAKLLKHRKPHAVVYERSQTSLLEKVKALKRK
jgi:hypothetical protein